MGKETITYVRKEYTYNPKTDTSKLISEETAELRMPTPENPHTSAEIESAFSEKKDKPCQSEKSVSKCPSIT